MPHSRYNRTPVLAFGAKFGTSAATAVIRSAVQGGTISTDQLLMRENERLDVLAGQIYGDARYWWVLAAASDIGWGLQVPPGTVIRIPQLSDVINLIG